MQQHIAISVESDHFRDLRIQQLDQAFLTAPVAVGGVEERDLAHACRYRKLEPKLVSVFSKLAIGSGSSGGRIDSCPCAAARTSTEDPSGE